MAEGKKGRKIGRNKKRPSQVRYVMLHRSETNRAAKIARTAKFRAACAELRQEGIAVPRGTARKLRREKCRALNGILNAEVWAGWQKPAD